MIGHEGMRVRLYERPRGARGILPLILGAIAGGRALYGAIDANQKKKRQEGFIEDSYRTAKGRLDTRQGLERQGAAESLNARGLGGISPIQGAMLGKAGTVTPHSIGEQVGADDEKQFGLEQTDLTQQRDRALQDNTDQRTSSYINSAFAGASAGVNAYGASQELGAMKALGDGGAAAGLNLGETPGIQQTPNAGAAPPGASAPMGLIQKAMMPQRVSSVMHPNNWYAGAVGLDPIRAAGSSWHEDNHSTHIAQGESNAEFHVG